MTRVDKEMVESRLANFHHVCRERGFRVTPQRLAIYRELARSTDHPSVEDIHKRIRKSLPTVTLDTVYRTFGSLEKLGIVVRVSVVGDRFRFEANTRKHHHFVCRRCGRITDVWSKKLERLRLGEDLPPGYTAECAHIEFQGTCPKCGEDGGQRPSAKTPLR